MEAKVANPKPDPKVLCKYQFIEVDPDNVNLSRAKVIMEELIKEPLGLEDLKKEIDTMGKENETSLNMARKNHEKTAIIKRIINQ